MITAGIDAGSRTVKVVLLENDSKRVLASGIADQGIKQADIAMRLLAEVCEKAGVSRSDIWKTVATGYGRNAIDWADKAITEITCQACGVGFQEPDARTVIDIGGQDSKLVRIGDNGKVRDFVMNDRCAAGTGRFLEVVAARLDLTIPQMGAAACRADNPSAISSMCVVFAETEIIGLLASGESPENIAAGVQRSIASRVRSMAGKRAAEPVVFTGGVALIPGMKTAITEIIGLPVKVTSNPQSTGALGAAILAVN
jgi:predicted CoA-substrate-specific enzyme activase